MNKYEFGGRRGSCAFAETIWADSYRDAVNQAEEWCEEHDAVFEYCILANN